MKIKSAINIVLTLCILLWGCQSGHKNHQMDHKMDDHGQDGHNHHNHRAMESAEPGEGSLFHLTGNWTNQEGEKVQLEKFQGHYTVLSMVYTSCQYACPALVADMRKIEEQLPEGALENTRFVLVSFDSENDTPEKLAAYRESMGFDKGRWELLHGDPSSVMELAAVLGVKYRKMGAKDFSHSNLVTVLDPSGEVIYRQEGLNNQPDQALQMIQ